MAACQILDFGAVPTRKRTDKAPETDPQQIQNENVNRYLERSGSVVGWEIKTGALIATEQSGRLVSLPLSVSVVESQIESLPTSEDVEVPPTTYAHAEAKRVIASAYMEIFSAKPNVRTLTPPNPIIGTDDVGGIMVSWTSGNKYVAAKFASRPESRSFLYFEQQAAEHQALDLNELTLSEKLRWLSA
jgi:hypothetical protein